MTPFWLCGLGLVLCSRSLSRGTYTQDLEHLACSLLWCLPSWHVGLANATHPWLEGHLLLLPLSLSPSCPVIHQDMCSWSKSIPTMHSGVIWKKNIRNLYRIGGTELHIFFSVLSGAPECLLWLVALTSWSKFGGRQVHLAAWRVLVGWISHLALAF